MFMGEYSHTLDTKGRLIIPAKFRNQLGEKFIVTKWMEKSLRAMPLSVWEKLENQLNQLPTGKKDARSFRRFVMAGALEAEFDKQGRIIVPSNLREYALALVILLKFGVLTLGLRTQLKQLKTLMILLRD